MRKYKPCLDKLTTSCSGWEHLVPIWLPDLLSSGVLVELTWDFHASWQQLTFWPKDWITLTSASRLGLFYSLPFFGLHRAGLVTIDIQHHQQTFSATLYPTHVKAHRKCYDATDIIWSKCSTVRLNLLLQAGDIQVNTGPPKHRYVPKYPCGVCEKACKWGTCCIQCEGCETWFHKDCENINTAVFNVIASNEAEPWPCHQCRLPNLRSSLFESAQTDNTTSSSVTEGHLSVLLESPIVGCPPIAPSSPHRAPRIQGIKIYAL